MSEAVGRRLNTKLSNVPIANGSKNGPAFQAVARIVDKAESEKRQI